MLSVLHVLGLYYLIPRVQSVAKRLLVVYNDANNNLIVILLEIGAMHRSAPWFYIEAVSGRATRGLLRCDRGHLEVPHKARSFRRAALATSPAVWTCHEVTSLNLL